MSSEDQRRALALIEEDPVAYGLPIRRYDSVVFASFNVRKLGSVHKRRESTWDFLAGICRHFDLIAVQEVMEDLGGLDHLREKMGSSFHCVASDVTGVFPGESGMGERLAFIYNHRVIERRNVVSDISMDRTKIVSTIANNIEEFQACLGPYKEYLDELDTYKAGEGPKPKKVSLSLPMFLDFIRSPFIASFSLLGHPHAKPIELIAINAHLIYRSLTDRRQEFDALMEWVKSRASENADTYAPNFVLMGDLNLDFNNPETDRPKIDAHIDEFNSETDEHGATAHFPFLHPHPDAGDEIFRTNLRQTETYDQIGFFIRDERLSCDPQPLDASPAERQQDYGVVNIPKLLARAIHDKDLDDLDDEERSSMIASAQYEITDHLPIWTRLMRP